MNQESGEVTEEQETSEPSEELAESPEMAPTDAGGDADVEEDQQAIEAQSAPLKKTEEESQDKPEKGKLEAKTPPEEKPGEGKGGRVHTVPAVASTDASESSPPSEPTTTDSQLVLGEAERIDVLDEAQAPEPSEGEAGGETLADVDRGVAQVEQDVEEMRAGAAVDVDREGTTDAARGGGSPVVRGAEAVGEALASAAVDVDRHAGPAREVAGDAADGVLRIQDAASRVARDAANGAGDAMSRVTGETVNSAKSLRDAAMDAARDIGRRAVDSVEDHARAFPESAARSLEILRDAISAHVRMRPLREYYRDRDQESDEEAEDNQDER